MLIVEGPDAVGKSTFCKTIADNIEMRCGVRPKERHYGSECATMCLQQYYDACEMYTIQDRFHLSEIVYGQVARGSSNIGTSHEYGLIAINGRILSVGGIVVIVCAEPDVYEDILQFNYNEDEQAFSMEIARNANKLFYSMRNIHAATMLGSSLVFCNIREPDCWISECSEVVDTVLKTYIEKQRYISASHRTRWT